MKKMILALATIFNVSMASAAHDHPSVHGMLIVGQNKVYLSHLPMFHSPHDYQVIFEAIFSEPALNAYKASLAASNETVYTLVPESFVLPDMVAHPKPFKAQIYKGHFERGGLKIADNVTVQVKVIFAKKLNPADKSPSTAKFILFGNSEEQFMAHEIISKPDFDQISAVKTSTFVKNQLETGLHLKAGSTESNTVALKPPVALTLETNGGNSIVDVEKSLYLEFDDLAM